MPDIFELVDAAAHGTIEVVAHTPEIIDAVPEVIDAGIVIGANILDELFG